MNAPGPTQHALRDLAEFQVDATSVKLLGYSFCRRKRTVVLGVLDSDEPTAAVTIGLLDPADTALVSTVAQFLQRPVVPARLSEIDIFKALDIGYGKWETPTQATKLVVRDLDGQVASDHPMHALLESMLARALAVGATALHLAPSATDVSVRMRVDGVLHALPTPLDHHNYAAFVTRLQDLTGMPSEPQGVPRSACVDVDVADASGLCRVTVRVAALPGRFGDDLTLRLHSDTLSPRTLEQLGLPAAGVEPLMTALGGSNGLVLFSGPPRAGVTTSLYAALSHQQALGRKIMCVENPVARPLDFATQHALGHGGEPGTELADILHAFAEHDPDTVAVDVGQTTGLGGLLAAQGFAPNLTLVGMVASDPAMAVQQLLESGAPGLWLADTLTMVVHQRLVRRACAHCVPAPATPTGAAACQACGGTGYAGLLALFEVLSLGPHSANALAQELGPAKLRDAAIADGMVSAHDSGMAQVATGATTLEELRRVLPPRLFA